MTGLLERIERYYDAVPRRFARVEECGPFTLFLGEPGGWVYYARPRLGFTNGIGGSGGSGGFDAVDVAAATGRLRELGLPEVVEWVDETTPDLRGAVQDEGSLTVQELPLMVLDDDTGSAHAPSELPPDVRVRLLGPADGAAVAAGRAVSELGFGSAGTSRGEPGPRERDARLRPVQQRVLALIAEGAVRMAVAESDAEGVLAVGRTLPIDGVTEVMGVATLPSKRRAGLGSAVTRALTGDARALDVDTVFLTASSPEVARIYSGVGFRRVATAFSAEGQDQP
ncbi:MAG TPA: GNAT family N-acetyltransferase [Actinomycetes bacterium]|nr:GNAT family N-acetyltransferase [Actinomycetes bacterium]